jgi:hypothetical protein
MPLVKTVTKAGLGGKLFTGVEVKVGVGPACYRIHRKKGDLAVVDVAQLDYGVIGSSAETDLNLAHVVGDGHANRAKP